MNHSVLFGKGKGESVLVQLFDNEWMIVDSCFNNSKQPAAIEYLKSKGLDPASCVKIIVISHFHDDHIKGLSSIIELCKEATVCISSALSSKEFESYINAISNKDQALKNTTEINKIMAHFKQLSGQGRLKHAIADRTLYKNESISVISLSPCDRDVTQSDAQFSNLLKVKENTRESDKSAAFINPNHYSVVLRVLNESSCHEMLLGADLEVKESAGWDAVCECISTPAPNRVNIFKIPHHGSVTGYHERTWNELINSSPECIMTTYSSSGGLPTAEMIKVYSSKAKGLYCASTPKNYERPDDYKEIIKSINKDSPSVEFQHKNNKFGYITIDDCFSGAPHMRTYGDAVKIV